MRELSPAEYWIMKKINLKSLVEKWTERKEEPTYVIIIRRKQIEEELAQIRAQLLDIAKQLNVSSIEELEEIFKTRELDRPEVDLAWPKYVYLKEKYERLLRIIEKT
ncbi:MAG: hypothetical protein DRN15_06405 [Thermoprotei archaeon]|nr:MAG: hypothetical protein DRM97_08100 [Thermoprotei archaeon]RLF23448.1 MAG: hypothetical protein DRN15_06405 [Thermoprotei archaeon]